MQKSSFYLLLITILGSSLAFIDGTVVHVALPILQKDLNTDLRGIQWVVNIYTLFLASFILIGGTLGDRFGMRKIFVWGVVLFTFASILCTFSWDITSLIFFRALQGLGAALLTPNSLALLSQHFRGEEKGRAIGIWGAFTSITTAFGPVLGGWIMDNFGWRMIFFINAPIAVVILFLTFTKIKETEKDHKPLDVIGAMLTILALGLVSYALIEASEYGFNPLVSSLLLTGGFVTVFLFLWEGKVSSPMIPLPLFKYPSFAIANIVTVLLYAALGILTFVFPYHLMNVSGYSALEAGSVFLPFVVLMALISPRSGAWAGKHGARWPMVIGTALCTMSFMVMYWIGRLGNYWTEVFPSIFLFGLGLSLAVAPLTTAVFSEVPKKMSGIASGVNNFMARGGSLIAIAGVGPILTYFFWLNLKNKLIQLEVKENILEQLSEHKTALMQLDLTTLNLIEPKVFELKKNAFLIAYQNSMILCAGLCLLSCLIALFFMKKAKHPSA